MRCLHDSPMERFKVKRVYLKMKEDVMFLNIGLLQSYLLNHWTKHTIVCTHFDAFSMLLPKMNTKYLIISETFINFLKKKKKKALSA